MINNILSNNEIQSFIKDFVNDLANNNVAVFAGAGLSKGAGFVNWAELLEDVAAELGLDINKETDLISLAQYHVNENQSRSKINKKILEEFVEDIDLTENHRILANLPINTYWTTNYDMLIEQSLKQAQKIVDVKYNDDQLLLNRSKRDAVVYKMHGDVAHPGDAVITKEDYERYSTDHEPFISALKGDLMTKTFLFIGFSFTDPNLDHVLSRLNIKYQKNKRQHFCIIKSHKLGDPLNPDPATLDYNNIKQRLKINDLKRYGIKTLIIEDYPDITVIMKEIEARFKKGTVFISGSAEEYGEWKVPDAKKFLHLLSKNLINSGFRVVNGFGLGVGSGIINGALDAIYSRPEKLSEDQLIIRPFPQFETGNKRLPQLWEEYRQRMISKAGVAIFIFGNKKDENGKIVLANGVKREFEIAIEHSLIPIPLPITGFVALKLYNEVLENSNDFYPGFEWIVPLLQELGDNKIEIAEYVNKVITIIKRLNS